jgi:hypothetical protein
MSSDQIITEIPKEFVRKWWWEIQNGLPNEKAW